MLYILALSTSLHAFAQAPRSVNTAEGARVVEVSQAYLGKPYELGPLGEGPDGTISTKPLWNEERFDCTTLVETVMARAYATDDGPDRDCLMRHIRYENGQVSFLNRLHLPDSEWMPNQRRLGLLADVTERIGGEAAQINAATVSRAAWVNGLKASAVAREVSPAERAALLKEIKRQSAGEAPVAVEVAYLPLDSLKSDAQLIARLPNGAVFNVVRRGIDWIVRGRTARVEALVSHQGFIVRKGQQVFVRSATMLRGARVSDMRLDTYVAYLKSIVDPKTGEENILGLNIMAPLPRPPELCRAGR